MADIVRLHERRARAPAKATVEIGEATILLFTGIQYQRVISIAAIPPSGLIPGRLATPNAQISSRDPVNV